ncbi:MAG: RagB/SusD family nutrient uptake outer membrane protein [Cytophagaceae bacterium]|nr:RagB/SusD family nutrient uptake outer membrane protein [Cytophagaceae bacterium]
MKKISIAIVFLALIVGGYSCKDTFLDVAPTGSISKNQLTTKAGLEGSLIAAYAQLSGLGSYAGGPSNWVWGAIRGGDANKGTDPGDFSDINPIQRFEYNPSLPFSGELYREHFDGVARANATLALIKEAQPDVKEEEKVRMAAEAKFIRAHFYFQLKRNFDNVPYVDENINVSNGIEKVKNDVDIWPKIEADFKEAFDKLPETQTAVGRANKWAAAAYLAKAYMFQKKYPEAKALFDQIIANGKTAGGKKYALLPKYSDLYRVANDNSAESVFAVQATVKSGNGNNANADLQLNFIQGTEPGTCCGFFQPTFEFVNSFRTTADGLPYLDGSYNDPSKAVKHDMGIASTAGFTPDNGPLDPRLDHTVGRRGIPFLDWGLHTGFSMIRNQPNAGPYSPKKYLYTKAEKAAGMTETGGWGHQTFNAYNVTIIRYADVLLMAAEAEIEAGSLAKALEYTNMVRGRAANESDYVKIDGAPAANYSIKTYASFPDKDFARAAVRYERRMELGMEGHRFYDLVRWGEDVAAINKYLKYDQVLLPGAFGGASYQAKHKILPLPQSQIDLVGADVLKQNAGY